jgi:hypothetical protein
MSDLAPLQPSRVLLVLAPTVWMPQSSARESS